METNLELTLSKIQETQSIQEVKYHNDFKKMIFYKLTEAEFNVFITICFKIKETNKSEIKISVKEIMSALGVNFNKEYVKLNITNLGKKLIQTQIEIESKDVQGVSNVFTDFLLIDNKENVSIQINKNYLYLFNDLTTSYTSFELRKFLEVEGKYTKKFFILIIPFYKTTGWAIFKFEDLKEYLDFPKGYRDSHILKKIREIKEELSKIDYFKYLNFSLIKEGKKIKNIQFKWEPMEPIKEIGMEQTNDEKIEVIGKESKISQRNIKEIKANHYIDKQESDKRRVEEVNNDVERIYQDYLLLPEKNKKEISEKAYSEFLKKTEVNDSSLMRNIFEKSKKTFIVNIMKSEKNSISKIKFEALESFKSNKELYQKILSLNNDDEIIELISNFLNV